ncbi:radical SAM protein [Sedimentitalea todarodis]|uniref:Radical SAM protein n=1 Tax=Sedimentitalea todarodis TaxID=1631240 RepID=A0ABU3VCF9_9RHOB|nr:radical SAM protein [Sedimentitalea todarodis]MDU9003858.1 radical SAM protein [Sedimentitalea todarodis]
MKDLATQPANAGKFQNRFVTAQGETRASVPLSKPETLWFNTGTQCNIECENCYILSSPTNDALVYISTDEVNAYLDQISERGWPIREIGFTGGEPFMNPEMIDMARAALSRGFEVLILTNAMRPMMRRTMREGLIELQRLYGTQMTLRVSLDHYSRDLHDAERGAGSFAKTMTGMDWLRDTGIRTTVAGRAHFDEDEASGRAGFAALFESNGFAINAQSPAELVLFPEMDAEVEVPEITTSCWDILGKRPEDVMCASSRMVVRRKGADHPVVLACTLLPYSPEFELGETLSDAEQDVQLNHPHCAKFCVLGGASCSA